MEIVLAKNKNLNNVKGKEKILSDKKLGILVALNKYSLNRLICKGFH